MKTLKISLLALVFIAGIGGAVVQKIQAAPKPVDTFYNWTSTSSAPKDPSSTLNNATVAQAESNFGCSTGTIDCADGTKVSGPGPNTQQILHN
jgi:Flp pilus assembly protein CpaB